MSLSVSNRVTLIKPSATIAVNTKASQLKAEGRDIVNLSVGEPDFDTPDFIKAAAIQAINDGFTKYTAVDGIPELKDAIIHKFAVDNRLNYERNQISVSSGAKQVLYNLIQALLNPGDEVIIPAPYWVSYPDMVILAEATPVCVDTTMEQRFKITADQLEAAITPKTRLFIINSPSNPTGIAYTADELRALGDVLKKHPQVFIVSDDIYEYILWGADRFVNILNVCPELTSRTIIMNGVSKSYAMTGWRIGYGAGPKDIIAAMNKIQSQSTSNACSISQKASVTALNAKRDFFIPMLNAYKERHDFVLSALLQIKGVECLAADGAFYLFPGMAPIIKRLGLKDDVALAEYLLDKASVATVPGTAFGAPGHIRLSIATSIENLAEAMTRLAKALI